MEPYDKEKPQSGFTLIEVALAVLVMGLGLLSVFSLFPSGVRFSEDSVSDTRAGLFADTVFNQMRIRADSVTNWSDWEIADTFAQRVKPDTPPSPTLFPDGSDDYIRYQLTLDTGNPMRYSACLKVCDGQYGVFTAQSTFYTEFTFKGF